MPHEIETMAFFGEAPWHGLGTALTDDDLYDWRRACAKAGLDWDVELVPLVTADTQAPVEHRAVRRTSDGRVLGVVGPRFTVLQNRDAFKWFQPFLEAKEAALHTAGSLRHGSRVWVLAKLQRDPLVLARKSINQADLTKYVRRVLKVEGDRRTGTRLKHLMDEIIGMAESGRGNDLASVRGTYWTAYNGVTEWLAYQRGRSDDNRLNSLWFGDSPP